MVKSIDSFNHFNSLKEVKINDSTKHVVSYNNLSSREDYTMNLDDFNSKDKSSHKKSFFIDRLVGSYKGYDPNNLNIIISREYSRDQYGNKLGLKYNNIDEVIKDLDKLKKVYSDYEGFAYYNQNVYLETYKYDSIQVSGCCPTSFAMIATYLKGETILPTDVIDAFLPYCYSSGTDVTGECFPDVCSKFGLKANRLDAFNKEQLMSELKKGNPIILNVVAGQFTSSGHYIVLLGIDDNGNVIVADPNSVYNSTQTYPIEVLMSQTNNTDGAAWSFEKE